MLLELLVATFGLLTARARRRGLQDSLQIRKSLYCKTARKSYTGEDQGAWQGLHNSPEPDLRRFWARPKDLPPHALKRENGYWSGITLALALYSDNSNGIEFAEKWIPTIKKHNRRPVRQRTAEGTNSNPTSQETSSHRDIEGRNPAITANHLYTYGDAYLVNFIAW